MIQHLFASTEKRAAALAGNARDYLHGLLSEIPRKNMERMGEQMSGVSHENLQHFLSGSRWDEAKVYQWICGRASQRIGGHRNSMLLIDESAITKKGNDSVGVARQYNGRLGKTDNCQVGVFSALACGTRVTMIGSRLLLPKEWVDDPERCLKAGVPKAQIVLRSKIDLARQLVEEADEFGVEYAWVGVDAFYGRDQQLLCWLEDRGKGFVADVPDNLLVWSTRPSKEAIMAGKAAGGAISVGAWSKSHCKEGCGTQVILRVGENGPVAVDVWVRRVWLWPQHQEQPRQWWHVVRRDSDGSIKHTIVNAAPTASIEELAGLQGQRYFIERNFQDGKSHLGMAQYQARTWRSWHHHMAMVALGLLFTLEEKLLMQNEAPMLTTRDVVEILDWYLKERPNKDLLFARVSSRHKKREKLKLQAIERRRKKLEDFIPK